MLNNKSINSIFSFSEYLPSTIPNILCTQPEHYTFLLQRGQTEVKEVESENCFRNCAARLLSHLMCATLPTTDEHLILSINRVCLGGSKTRLPVGKF